MFSLEVGRLVRGLDRYCRRQNVLVSPKGHGGSMRSALGFLMVFDQQSGKLQKADMYSGRRTNSHGFDSDATKKVVSRRLACHP
jgi:hypothetical protein